MLFRILSISFSGFLLIASLQAMELPTSIDVLEKQNLAVHRLTLNAGKDSALGEGSTVELPSVADALQAK